MGRSELWIAQRRSGRPMRRGSRYVWTQTRLLMLSRRETYCYLFAAPRCTTSSGICWLPKSQSCVRKLADHFNPKQGVAVKHYQFTLRSRQPGESISKYVAELRHLAIGCEFGDLLLEMLCDRLVCGINTHECNEAYSPSPILTSTRHSRLHSRWRWQTETRSSCVKVQLRQHQGQR